MGAAWPTGLRDVTESAIEVTRLFTEGQNARDLEAVRTLVTEDVEFRNPRGTSLHGLEGLKDLLQAASDTDILLAREGAERVEDDDELCHVAVPMRLLVRKSELHGTALFDVRDGRVAAFEVVSASD